MILSILSNIKLPIMFAVLIHVLLILAPTVAWTICSLGRAWLSTPLCSGSFSVVWFMNYFR